MVATREIFVVWGVPMSEATATAVTSELQENHRAVSLAQKTELVGQIAQAIAHQFNNIMMAVSSYAELELKKAAPPQKRSLEQVLANSTRATALIQKLLAFSCKHSPSPQTLSLSVVLADIDTLVKQLLGESVEVVVNLDPKLPALKADLIEIEQMILSLVLHARNAMSHGGTLNISAEAVNLDKEFIGFSEPMTPGRYIALSISTKASGKRESQGKGDQNLRDHLALTAVRSMVKDMLGLIRVFNSPSEGSSFKVYLPALTQAATSTPGIEPAIKNAPLTKTVLVVDDDDAVRGPAAEFLMMEGYKVLQAKTGREALQIVEMQRSPVDLLITDIRMPEMNGREVAEKLLEKYSGLKVLYMSGDADRATSTSSTQGNAVLQKPFRLNVLNEKIKDLLTR
jgi:two-component system cell cycle sensor histidine kinase/response regulator CckA